jgi:hypothetical protein
MVRDQTAQVWGYPPSHKTRLDLDSDGADIEEYGCAHRRRMMGKRRSRDRLVVSWNATGMKNEFNIFKCANRAIVAMRTFSRFIYKQNPDCV